MRDTLKKYFKPKRNGLIIDESPSQVGWKRKGSEPAVKHSLDSGKQLMMGHSASTGGITKNRGTSLEPKSFPKGAALGKGRKEGRHQGSSVLTTLQINKIRQH